jgi:hypothetical protein
MTSECGKSEKCGWNQCGADTLVREKPQSVNEDCRKDVAE